MQLTPLAKTKTSSSGKSFPPLGPDTKVFVVWVERFDDIGRNIVFKLKLDLYQHQDQESTLLIVLLRTSAMLGLVACRFFRMWMTLFPFCRELPLVWSVGGNQHWFGSQPEQQHFLQVLTSLHSKQANSSANGHVHGLIVVSSRTVSKKQLQIKKEAQPVVAWKQNLHSQYQMNSLAEFIFSRECAVSRFKSDKKCQVQKRSGWVQS